MTCIDRTPFRGKQEAHQLQPVGFRYVWWKMLLTLITTASEQVVTNDLTTIEMIAWASGIATAIATGLTAIFTIWFRRIDHPRAQWDIVFDSQDWQLDPEAGLDSAVYMFRLSNVGTGPAQSVSFIGVFCGIQVLDQDNGTRDLQISRAEVGYSARLRVSVMPSKWDQVRLIVTWAEPAPWRRGRKYRKTEFKFSKHFNEPELYLSDPDINPGYRTRVPLTKKELENPHLKKQISEQEEFIANHWPVFHASKNWFRRRRQFRTLRKAGWGWRRVLPTLNTAQSDSSDDAATRS